MQHRVSFLPAVLLSLPSPARVVTSVNVAINTAVLLLALDFVFYPLIDNAKDVTFTRVGAVYPDAAKLIIRYPIPNATQGELKVLWRQTVEGGEMSWNAGPAVSLNAEGDWVGTTRLDGLWPSTSYECKFLSAELTGFVLIPSLRSCKMSLVTVTTSHSRTHRSQFNSAHSRILA